MVEQFEASEQRVVNANGDGGVNLLAVTDQGGGRVNYASTDTGFDDPDVNAMLGGFSVTDKAGSEQNQAGKGEIRVDRDPDTGRIRSQTNANGDKQEFGYDQNGQLNSMVVTKADGTRAVYKKTDRGDWEVKLGDDKIKIYRNVSVDQGNGEVRFDNPDGSGYAIEQNGTRFDFDQKGRTTREYNPSEGTTTTWTYNGDSNVATASETKNNVTGDIIETTQTQPPRQFFNNPDGRGAMPSQPEEPPINRPTPPKPPSQNPGYDDGDPNTPHLVP